MSAQVRKLVEELFALRWMGNGAFRRQYYRLKSSCPYRRLSRWRRQTGFPDIYTYGETPLTTFAKIAREIGLDSTKSFLDLGAGRGLLVLFAREILGCRAEGIDHCPSFASSLVCCAEIRTVDVSDFDVVYCAWTCLSDEEIEEALPIFSRLKPEAIVLTTSFALTDYSDQFETIQVLPAQFFWGKTEIYAVRRRASSAAI